MTDAALRIIGEQLELIDQAIDTGSIEHVAAMSWRAPTGDLTDRDGIIRLLDRIDEIEQRMTELRAETVAAQAAIEMKRQVARLYSGGTPGGAHLSRSAAAPATTRP